MPRKNVHTRQPSAFSHSSTKSSASLRKCTPKKRSRHTAFGFWSILFEKSLQRLAAMPRKSTAPDSLRLLVNTSRKTTQVARCDDPKKCGSRLPSAFGQSPAKSPVSLRRYTPEKCLRPSASDCLFPPTARLPKRSTAMARKSATPDCLRLLVDTPRKVPPAFGNVPQPFASGCRL